MSKFKPTNAKKKDLTPEESAKLEAFGNEATTNPGTLGENGKTPEAKSPTNLDTISPTPSRTELVSNQNETSEEANRKPRAKKAKKAKASSDKPKRSFTVPMNDYELDLLRELAEKEDRSQRWIARKMLVGSLEAALKKR